MGTASRDASPAAAPCAVRCAALRVQSWMSGLGNDVDGTETMPQLRRKVIAQVLEKAEAYLSDDAHTGALLHAMSKHFENMNAPGVYLCAQRACRVCRGSRVPVEL